MKKVLISDKLYFLPDDSKYGTFSAEKQVSLLNFDFRTKPKDGYIIPDIAIGSRHGYSRATKEEIS